MYYGCNIQKDGFYITIKSEDESELISIIKKIDSNLITKKINQDTFIISYNELAIKEIKAELLERSMEIIRKRIDFSGTKEVDIYRQGLDSIVLEVPGVNEPEKIKSLINTSAKLTFHLLHPINPILQSANDIDTIVKDGYILMQPYNPNDNSVFVVNNNIEIDGANLVDAKANITAEGPVVFFKFDSRGSRDFSLVTGNNIGKPLAIVLDGKVISSPIIKSQISGGDGVISGNFTIDEVKNMSLLLRSGALPATLDIVEEGVVGPTLGYKFLNSGIKAFFCSFILVSLFMLYKYKTLGIIAIVSIFYNSVMILGIFSLLGITLTISGIAGITLTIGMAVDANVLIFEKIIENLKLKFNKGYDKQTDLYNKNKSIVINTIQDAFSTAFNAIFDSNITTIIAAFMIFILTFGSIKGFAVALSIGVLCSLYSCVFITKILVFVFIKNFKIAKYV